MTWWTDWYQWVWHFMISYDFITYLFFVFIQFVWENLTYHLGYIMRANCTIWIIIWMMVFWTLCTQIYIAMCNLRTHGQKYCHSNNDSNCAIQTIIQIAHFCSPLKTVIIHKNLISGIYSSKHWSSRPNSSNN